MSWTYWRAIEWNGIVVADNEKSHCMWIPETGKWCWPGPGGEYDPKHWQETTPLEYLTRTGDPLPEPPAGSEEEWVEHYNGRKQ